MTLNLGPIEDTMKGQSASTTDSPPNPNENVYILSNPGGVTRVTNLRVVPTLNSGLRVTAEQARDAKGGYRVNWRVKGNDSFLGPANIDKFPYEITGLNPGTTYVVRVSTLDADGNEVRKTNVSGSGTTTSAMVDSSLLKGTVTEGAEPNTVSKILTITEVDDATFTEQADVPGDYGSFRITSAGVWTYTLDNSAGGATDKLNGTEAPKKTDVFTIMAADGTSGTVTITITGVDDPSTLSGGFEGSVTEDSTANAMATGEITVADVDTTPIPTITAQTNKAGTYGSFTLRKKTPSDEADRVYSWTYTLDNTDEDTNALAAGTIVEDEFTITTSDGVNAKVTITITGADDSSTIGGGLSGSVTEDNSANLTAEGTATITDEDSEATFTAQTDTPGSYGTFSITTAGDWTYSLDNSPGDILGNATNALKAGQTESETFPITTSDGNSVNVTITVNGANDAALFGTTGLTGAITEDMDPNTVTDTVTSTDVDGDDNKFTAVTAPASVSGTYGSLTITEDGAWTYSLDNSNAMVNALGQDAPLTDSLTIQTADGTEGTITINITGVNDKSSIDVTGSEGAVTEDDTANATVTGTFTLTDPDTSPLPTISKETQTGTYGQLAIAVKTRGTNDGEYTWTYTLDNDDSDTNALTAGSTATETFTIAASDNGEAMVTISITGANDPATFSGLATRSGAVTEDATSNTATANITVSDVDGDNALKEQADQTGIYGSLSVDHSAGTWTYTLTNSGDNAQARATQALAGGARATETFTILAADDTPTTLTITITGVNDAATIGGDVTSSIAEGTASTTGTVTSTDPDGTDNTFKTEVSPNDGTTRTTGTGDYGTLTITSAGVWTYTLDNSDGGATDLLDGNEDPKETDIFTIMAADGTSGTVTITITGVSDDATIGGDVTSSIAEGTASTTGTVTSTDPDGTDNTFKTEVSPNDGTTRTTGTGDYGTLTITSDGVWTYTLDNSPGGATDLLAGDATATDAFTIMAADGTSGTVTITITGANDPAVFGMTGLTGSITEDAAPNTVTDTATSTDVDGEDNKFTAVTAPASVSGSYGSLTITEDGAWTYSLDNSNATVNALIQDATLTDSLTIQAKDGTAGTITITITGVNDKSSIDVTGSGGAVTEDDTDNATVTGTFTLTDPDTSPLPTITEETMTGTYGRLAIAPKTSGTNNGEYTWTYKLDNEDGDTDALAAGSTETETFTIAASDNGEAMVTISITGANDPATFSGLATRSGAVTEDATSNTATANITVSDVDGDNALKEQADQTGIYGSLSVDHSAGTWTYTLTNSGDNAQARATQALAGGARATETFTILAADDTPTTLTITITGVNDAATIGGDVTSSIAEGTASTTGTVTSTDPDGTDNTFKTEVSPNDGTTRTTGTGDYGTLTITSAGVWTYTLDNSDGGATDLLDGNEDPKETDIFTIMAADGTSGTVTITITGVSDDATIGGDVTSSIAEGTASTTGTVTSTDPDGTDNTFKTEVSPNDGTTRTTGTGDYGTLTITSDGVWTYTLDNSPGGATDLLAGDATATDAFTIMAADGTSGTVTITITGANDPAVFGMTGLTGSITEDAAPNTVTDTATSTDVDGEDNKFTAVTAPASVSGSYGSLTITEDGAWTYSLDNSNATVNALIQDATLTDSLTIQAKDGTAGTITITITGVNDKSSIDVTGSGGAVTEDDTDNATVTGTFTLTDPDTSPLPTITEETMTGTYGRLAIAPKTSGTNNGEYTWTYKLDNEDGDTDALAAGSTETETFTIAASDNGEAMVTISITGANDPATFSGLATRSGAVTEDAAVDTATANITVSDVDGDNALKEQADQTGIYGSLSVDHSAGTWTYTLTNSGDNAQARATQALAGGARATETFTILAADDTPTTLTITITGVNDAATIGGDVTSSIAEGTASTTGTVTSTDPDGTDNTFKTEVSPNDGTTRTTGTGDYGTLTITSAGVWTYTLDNSDGGATDLLDGNEDPKETDIFTIMAADGTSGTVTITITGVSDDATIGGDVTGSITEGKASTTGTVTSTDPDGADNTFKTEVSPNDGTTRTTGTGDYGTLTITSDGVWTYTLDNSPGGATDLLAGDATATDAFTIMAADGTSGTVTITITGANDPAVFGMTGLTGSITEDAAPNTVTDTATSTDVDGEDNKFTAVTAPASVSGSYGSLTITEDGAWTYSLDNSNATVNALIQDATLTDSLTIQAKDGTAGTITITITGVNDAAVFGTTGLTGAITEGTASTTGTVTSTDVDGTDNSFKTEVSPTTGTYGSLTITTAGAWTYTLDNSAGGATDLLDGTEDPKKTDVFTIMAADGTEAMVTITITGVNDAATFGGTSTGSVMEDGTLTASGSVTVADVDGDDALKEQADQTSIYGSLSVDHSTGNWTYTLNNDAAAVQALTGGARGVPDSFTIMAADGTEATVTITITGAIDPGDIAGATGSVTEDDTLKARARGRVIVDGVSDATFTAQTNVSRTYGTFNLEANGNWTYDLDNSRPATNALAGEAEVRDTLEIATANNSATAVLIITVTGNDDRSTIDAANLAGSVMEDGTLMASKTVTVTDVDTDPEIEERPEFPSAYGTFSITSAGVWTYTLDNNAAAVQALGAGQTLTEAFKIETEDGAEAVITITITGTDDPNEIEGTVTGSVTEDDEEASSASGTVTVTGSTGATFAVKAMVPPQSQTYGTFTIQSDGNWTYTLTNSGDNARARATQALAGGQTETETITIEASLEGNTAVEKDVTITITGVNDAATIGGVLTGDITEGTASTPDTVTGTATVTDVDGDDSFSTEVTPAQGIYGSLTLTSAGKWTYTLNNADPDTNALTAGQEVTDSFTIEADDGTETAVTITVTGVTDRDEIEGDVSGSVREAAGDEDDQAMASGRVRVADDPAARFTVQENKVTTYGTFSLTEEGDWTYRLNNDRVETDALGQGEIATDPIIIEATASDNTPRTATVTITVIGSEVGGDLTGSIRDGSQTPVVGKLTTEQGYDIVDVEDIRPGKFGCLRVRSDGSWTYWLYGTDDDDLCPRPIEALAQSGTVTALAAEQARMDVFTIKVRRPDGMVIMVSLTITIEEAAAPVTRTDAVTGYLQGRAEVLLGKQPELVQFLKNLRSGITSEGQVSVDVRDGALMGFDGSFVRDGLWGALNVARSEQGSGKTEQIFGTLGYHGQVADAAFVGLMLQFDQADGELDAGLGSIDGQGWLFGPYFAAQYQAQQPWISPLTLEGRLLYGPTRNDVRFVDGGTGTFDTQRWLASFRLEGEVLLDYGDRAIRLIPHFDAGWVQDKVEAFTDSAGMQVAGQTIRFSEVALGSDIEVPVRFGQRDAMITGGLSLVSTREQSQGQNANKVSVSDTHGRLELGLGYRLANGIELEFGGSYDDVEGADSEDKFSLSFGLSSQF